jgi:CrcB protein
MTASHLLYVALGGALGAIGRYGVVSAIGAAFGHGLPFGTLFVNVIGSFVLGIFVEISALVWSPSPELRAMIVVGVLGAFATFSTFSLDVVTLFTRGDHTQAFVYVISSVVLSIGALWAGMALTKLIIT